MPSLAPDGWVFAWTRVSGTLTGKFFPPDQIPPDAEIPRDDAPLEFGKTITLGAVIGSGDTTTTISDPNNKTQPYRFKEGTKAGQKAEIRKVMEERFQRDNKAPWKVDVDVGEY